MLTGGLTRQEDCDIIQKLNTHTGGSLEELRQREMLRGPGYHVSGWPHFPQSLEWLAVVAQH